MPVQQSVLSEGPPEVETLPVAELVFDLDCQARAGMSEEVLEEYTDAFRNGDTFPPVQVFEVERRLVIVDGFHRVEAAKRAKVETLPVKRVGSGSLQEARWHALGVNQKHGLRRTRDDKDKAVRLALKMYPGRSNRAIANHVGVSHPYVAKVRRGARVAEALDEWLIDPTVISDETRELVTKINQGLDHDFFAGVQELRWFDRIRRLDALGVLDQWNPEGAEVEYSLPAFELLVCEAIDAHRNEIPRDSRDMFDRLTSAMRAESAQDREINAKAFQEYRELIAEMRAP